MIFGENKEELEKFKVTSFQKRILRRDPNLSNIFIGRSEIKEENGYWKLTDEVIRKLISEGGEALIFLEKFSKTDMVVRIQAFDPFLFTAMLRCDEFKWRTHLISGGSSFVITQE